MGTSLVAGLAMFVALVVVHEFGHFVVAKLFGIGVPVFSIGMGPKVYGVEWRGTEYRLSALPLGGYVRLAGADPFGEEAVEEEVDPRLDFMRRPVYQRLLVMLAGPAFNLALPLVVFTGVLMLGEPQTIAQIGSVHAGSASEEAGLQAGDLILEVDGVPVHFWSEWIDALDTHKGRAVPLRIARGGEELQLTLGEGVIREGEAGHIDFEHLGLSTQWVSSRVGVDGAGSAAGRAGMITGDAVSSVDGVEVSTWEALMRAMTPGQPHQLEWLRADREGGITEHQGRIDPPLLWAPRPQDGLANPWGLVPVMVYVGQVMPGSAAAAAGILPDDRLLALDGAPVMDWANITMSTAGAVQARVLTLVRDDSLLEQRITPRMEREFLGGEVRYRPIMGIALYPDAFAPPVMEHGYYGITEAVPRAFEESRFLFQRTVGVLGRLLTGEVKPAESLGGPIEIFRIAGEGADHGIYAFLRLMGTISISLGVVNLLPVPVLDGGQILFYLVEGIRGRPLSLAFRERVQMVGVLFLVAVMLMVMVIDVNRLFSGG
ncbi:MAG: site-2 protease family protein [Deltaproteobacteria bacterium]|nr:site-2 protease family protein [Deltaproteobacteria bacterium]